MQIMPFSLSKFLSRAVDYASVMYLQQFTQKPPPFVDITVDISPFSYMAVEPGFVFVTAGTVSAIALDRGTDTLDFTGQMQVPVSIGDIVTVTYSVLPTMTFIPIYGAAPR